MLYRLHKPFDTVKYDMLIDIMKTYGTPAEDIRLIQHLHWKKKQAKVKTRSAKSKSFAVRKGVGQGCVLSPVLFNIYSEELTKAAHLGFMGIMVNYGKFKPW